MSFSYPGAAPALQDVSMELHPGERVALLGPSGSGKSTLLRALAGLVPHFHGGRFVGKVEVAGRDTRRVRPADLAGAVGSVFQDPEDQVVMTKVRNEVAFGLENLGVEPVDIWPRADEALEALRASHLTQRRTPTLSGGELQRVCLASALAQRPRLLLLDEPTSQLDPEAADRLISAVGELGCAFVLSEQRTMRALDVAERVLFLDRGRLLFDGPKPEALAWLSEYCPRYVDRSPTTLAGRSGSVVAELSEISFAYEPGTPVLERAELEVRRGEVVALEGPNGAGKTTLAKIAVGLLDPASGSVLRSGRAGYLSQDPGRYLVCEHVLEEVALGVHGDLARARVWLERVGLGFAADRHPRDLSSGERERLGLAAVAVSEPDLLALDEPTRGVDPDRKAELGAWLAEYAAAGRGVLVATHDRAFPAHRRVSLAREEALVAA